MANRDGETLVGAWFPDHEAEALMSLASNQGLTRSELLRRVLRAILTTHHLEY